MLPFSSLRTLDRSRRGLVALTVLALVLTGLALVTLPPVPPAQARGGSLSVSPTTYVGGQRLTWTGSVGAAGVRSLVDEAAELAERAVDDQSAYIAFRDNDTRFHRSLVELAELPRLLEMHSDLHLSIHITRAGLEAPLTHARLDTAVDEHRQIVEALEAGDLTAAQDALENHILRVRDQTIVFLSRPRVGATTA